MLFIGGSKHDGGCQEDNLGRTLVEVAEKSHDHKCFLAERDVAGEKFLFDELSKALDGADKWIIPITKSTLECKLCKFERETVLRKCVKGELFGTLVVVTDGVVGVPAFFRRFRQVCIEDGDFPQNLLTAIRGDDHHKSCESLLHYVYCDNKGCGTRYHCDEDHPSNCRHRLTTCKNSGCGLRLKAKDKLDHKRECPFESVCCTNKKCDKRIMRSELDAHKEVCKYEKVSCDNVLCSAEFCRKNVERHKKKCVYTASIKCSWCKKKFTGIEFRAHKHDCPVKRKNREKRVAQHKELNNSFMFSAMGR